MNIPYDATGGALAVNSQTGGFSMAPAAIPNQMMNTREHRHVAHQASVAAYADYCGTAITGMAIQHTALLSGLADQAANFSPAAEPHVRELVGEYVNTAKARVTGWNG